MKAFLAAIALIGFVGLNSFAQEGAEAPAAGAAMDNAGGERAPAKAKHKKTAKKKKHSKKHKGM